ncbi:MAG: glycoside hydrolase family 5 protein [Sphingomonas sp.]
MLGLFALASLGAAPAALAAQAASPALQQSDQPFRRGVNVLGYDPFWNEGGKRRFEWRHFGEIRRAGFDFVRINLQAFRHMDVNGRLEGQWLAKLDEVVREAQKAGLGIILDEHDFDVCSNDVDPCRAKLLAFWQQVAPRYSATPRNVAFELLNEPHDKLNGEVWNGLLAQALEVVRKTNPTRIVVVGPSHWNSLADLPLLKLPRDPNLLVTFHYYEPFHFTHQGATWAGDEVKQLHGVTWGSEKDRTAIRGDFDKVAAWSRANHRPILLGEFGAYDKSGTPLDLRVAYIAADRSEAERHGFGWAYWQFEGDFVVWDMANQRWIGPILKGLIP